MLEDRRLDVLRAIVEDFITTNEPVGSRALADRHHLGVSPATIRNDMAALEEDGYITQPHTSAGRVPTDKGYRLFVDRLASVKPLSPPERRAIQRFLDGAVDLDDVVMRTVRLLVQLTHQVAVVQYPTLSRSGVRHVELVRVGETRLLLVLITDTGRVEQRMIELTHPVTEEDVADIRAVVNGRVAGRLLSDAAAALTTLPDAVAADLRPTMVPVVGVMLESIVDQQEDRVVMGGTANLTRSAHDFPLTIRPVLEALEEQVVLLRLLGEATDPAAVTVRIGEETRHEGLRSTAVVAAAYGSGSLALGGLGVLGPTRMDYPATIRTVQAVARYVGRIVAGA